MQQIGSLLLAETKIFFEAIPPALLINGEQQIEIRQIFTGQLLTEVKLHGGMDRTTKH